MKETNTMKGFISPRRYEKISDYDHSEILKIIGLIVLLFCTAFLFTACGSSSAAGDSNVDPTASKTVSTKIIAASVQDTSKYINATGTFEADDSTDVAAETSGKVAQTLFSEGDFVKTGDVLVRLNEQDARLRLQQAQSAENQAKAQIAQAEAQLKQSQASLGLDSGGNFSVSNIPAVSQAKAALASAESDLTLARTTEKRYQNLLATGDTSKLFVDQKHNETEKAEAAVKQAQENLKGAENTARQGNQAIAASRANVVNAQAAYQTARSATALAQKTVNDTAIHAPFSGYVSVRSVSVGEYISPTTAVATIVRTNPIKIKLEVPEKEASNISIGMSVSAQVTAYAERNFAGKVLSVNPLVNETSRSLQVEVIVENAENLLSPGMFATARILQPQGETGIYVPQSALFTDTNTNSLGVYAVKDGVANLRTVQIDETTKDYQEIRILSGIAEGEQVATTNVEQLFDGAKVINE